MTIICWNWVYNPSLLNPPLHKLQASSGVQGRLPHEIFWILTPWSPISYVSKSLLKTGYWSDFNLESVFYYSKYIYLEKSDQFLVKTSVDFPLRWCLRNECKNFYTYYQWLLFSFETVFITRLHPITLCTLLPSLWSRLRERPSLIFATPPLVLFARWCLRNELNNCYSVNVSLWIQVVLLIAWTKFSATQNSQPRSG